MTVSRETSQGSISRAGDGFDEKLRSLLGSPMLHLAGSAVPESPLAAYKNRIAEANCRIERRVRPQEYSTRA
jgi:hypothetical protein